MSSRSRGAVRSLLAGGFLTAAWLLLGPTTAAHAADRSVDLWAVSGTTSLPGASSLAVWGYTTDGSAVTAPGGPVVTVDQGDVVTVHLHNTLAESTSLYVGGQAMVPDTAGVGTDGTKDYTFTAGRPGTYLYEAGLTAGMERQTAMGLHGALVVRPAATNQAYADASTAFDAQSVLVLSELDPALSANPTGFDMRAFKPRYFLVNGKVHPQADPIPAASGQKLLLRYVNAGVGYHSMGVLGASQRVVGLDGSELRNGATDLSRSYVAETFGPGQTADAIVQLPTTVTDRRLAVYDAALTLHNSNTAGTGGMLSLVTVAGTGATVPDTSGPATTGVAWSAGTLTATVSDAATGNGVVTAAEYRLDSVAAAPVAMTATTGFDAPTEAVTAPVAITAGQHVLYVRGKDGATWGPWSSVLVMGADNQGPTTTGVTLTPDRTNGSVAVAVSATGNDSASGGTAIGQAELSIDGGTPVAMTLETTGPVASVTGTVPAATVAGLAEGNHLVAVRSRDAAGNWGDPATATLVVDRTGPVPSALKVAPDPNNGLVPVNGSTPSVRLSATLTDDPSAVGAAQSTVVAAEGFVDTLGAVGTGIPLEASDGAWSTPAENAYLDIPLATVRQMTNGSHTLYVRGRDAAGNWGATGTTTLHVDKTAPVLTMTAPPAVVGGAATITVAGQATDTLSAVTAAEWFRGTDPGVGRGTPLTVSATGAVTGTIVSRSLPDGSVTLSFRVKDAAGNWSAVVTRTTTIRHQLRYSVVGTAALSGVGTTNSRDIYLFNGATHGLDTNLGSAGVPATANVDGFTRVSPTQYYVSFAAATTITGFGTVQPQDVVFRNGTTWQTYFVGAQNGVTANVDAISVVGSTLYLSLASNVVPPLAGGTGDDADVYRWNGGSSYTRVVDASTIGIPAAANVDGVEYVGPNEFFLSFSNDAAVTVTGLGAVADEDVIHRAGTLWSTYFDGSTHNLSAANLDVDEFDIP